jgi:hypothetical protein
MDVYINTMSAKELKDRLKALRSEFGRPITKMTAEEMTREIAHHETAKRATEIKAKRVETLAKAREARKTPAPAPAPAPVKAAKKTAPAPAPKPRVKKAKKEDTYSEASSTDHDSEDDEKHETIKSRMQKKD